MGQNLLFVLLSSENLSQLLHKKMSYKKMSSKKMSSSEKVFQKYQRKLPESIRESIYKYQGPIF